MEEQIKELETINEKLKTHIKWLSSSINDLTLSN